MTEKYLHLVNITNSDFIWVPYIFSDYVVGWGKGVATTLYFILLLVTVGHFLLHNTERSLTLKEITKNPSTMEGLK